MAPRSLQVRPPAAAAAAPEPDTPADVIRGLVLAAGGVTEPQAALLLRILHQLQGIEARAGRAAANAAAREVRAIWLRDVA